MGSTGSLKRIKGGWVIKAFVNEGPVEIEVGNLSVSEKKEGLLKIDEVALGDTGAELIPYLTIPLP